MIALRQIARRQKKREALSVSGGQKDIRDFNGAMQRAASVFFRGQRVAKRQEKTDELSSVRLVPPSRKDESGRIVGVLFAWIRARKEQFEGRARQVLARGMQKGRLVKKVIGVAIELFDKGRQAKDLVEIVMLNGDEKKPS